MIKPIYCPVDQALINYVCGECGFVLGYFDPYHVNILRDKSNPSWKYCPGCGVELGVLDVINNDNDRTVIV